LWPKKKKFPFEVSFMLEVGGSWDE